MSQQGIDVSHHQDPELFNWDHFSQVKSFLIARCSYGDRADERFNDFAKQCRTIGVTFGAYHFFRQQQSAIDQIEIIESKLAEVDYGFGDIYPALDMEDSQRWDGRVNADWHNTKGREIAQWLDHNYGKCIIYMSPSFWKLIGSPRWVLEHEIWVAHWDVKKPDSIGDRKHVIWQYDNSGPCDGYPQLLDLNECEDLESILIPDEIDDKSDIENDIDAEAITQKMSQMVNRLIELQSQSETLHSNVLELQQELRELIDIVKD